MAIKKKLIHFKNYSDFNSKKLSANEANTKYTQGVGGAIQDGSPDILYQSICWIKDTKQQWTHGQLYDLSGGGEMPDLADVAFSGDYEDLSNKPTIPAEQVNADWNATSGKAQILNKPTIPNGTITGVSANGTSVATSGVANIPAATTGKYGVTKLSSATNSTSTTLAATPSAVKSAYDLANGKYTKPSTGIPFGDFEEQVQGSIIKAEESVQSVSVGVTTGNATAGNFFNVTKDPSTGNVSIQMIQNTLASGKIAIPYTTDVKQYIDQAVANAGGGTGGSGIPAYREINHGTNETTITIMPNEFHVWDEVSDLTLAFEQEMLGYASEYLFQFTSGATPTTLTLPNDIKFTEDLVIEANKIYQISILKGFGSMLSWENPPAVTLINFQLLNFDLQAEEGMTWAEWINSPYKTKPVAISGNYVLFGGLKISYNGTPVSPNDTIMSGVRYLQIQET